MTKKDFQIIARAFMATQPLEDWGVEYLQWSQDVVTMAHELVKTNCQFDFEKFYAACGLI